MMFNTFREKGPTKRSCKGKATMTFIFQAFRYAGNKLSEIPCSIITPKSDIQVTMPVTIKQEIVKIIGTFFLDSVAV